MKPELIHLLDKLKAHPSMEAFQSLVIFPNGRALAFFRHGAHPFDNLEELEKFAYSGLELPDLHPPPLAPSNIEHPKSKIHP